MKIFFDHNLSPRLARAINELFRPEHEACALGDRFPRDVADTEWIANLSLDGQWIVISGDRRITRNKAEQAVFRNSRLIGIFLAPGVFKASVARQAERILALWPAIEGVAATVAGGAMFELPIKSNKLNQLK